MKSDEKRCSKCLKVKIRHMDFYMSKGTYRSECKVCTIKKNSRNQRKTKPWLNREVDLEKQRAYRTEYYAKNKEKFVKYREDFVKKNPEYFKEYSRKIKNKVFKPVTKTTTKTTRPDQTSDQRNTNCNE